MKWFLYTNVSSLISQWEWKKKTYLHFPTWYFALVRMHNHSFSKLRPKVFRQNFLICINPFVFMKRISVNFSMILNEQCFIPQMLITDKFRSLAHWSTSSLWQEVHNGSPGPVEWAAGMRPASEWQSLLYPFAAACWDMNSYNPERKGEGESGNKL